MPINKWQTIYYKDFPTVFQLFIRNSNPIITYMQYSTVSLCKCVRVSACVSAALGELFN